MTILHVARTASNIAEWIRTASGAINQLITGKLDLSGGTLTGDLSVPDEAYGVGWNGSLEVPTKNALYDKIETIAGGGVPDGDKGDIVVSSSGTVWEFDTSVVTAFAKTFLDDANAGAVLTTLGAQPLDATLTAVAAYNTNGLLTQTAADTFTGRTITAGNSGTTVTNGNGVSGNPTITSGVWALAGTGQTATGVWDFAVDGAKASVDFVGLSAFNELMIVIDAVTGSAGTANRTVRVSTDNGATFHSTSGDYVQLSAAGTVTNLGSCSFLSGATAAAATAFVLVRNMKGAIKAIVGVNPGNVFFRASASDINAIRVTSNTADTLNGGKIYCFAR